MSNEELGAMAQKTNFAHWTATEWSSSHSDGDRYIGQCSYFGPTLICLADTYEGSTEDCLFLEKLVQMYFSGQLVVKD